MNVSCHWLKAWSAWSKVFDPFLLNFLLARWLPLVFFTTRRFSFTSSFPSNLALHYQLFRTAKCAQSRIVIKVTISSLDLNTLPPHLRPEHWLKTSLDLHNWPENQFYPLIKPTTRIKSFRHSPPVIPRCLNRDSFLFLPSSCICHSEKGLQRGEMAVTSPTGLAEKGRSSSRNKTITDAVRTGLHFLRAA